MGEGCRSSAKGGDGRRDRGKEHRPAADVRFPPRCSGRCSGPCSFSSVSHVHSTPGNEASIRGQCNKRNGERRWRTVVHLAPLSEAFARSGLGRVVAATTTTAVARRRLSSSVLPCSISGIVVALLIGGRSLVAVCAVGGGVLGHGSRVGFPVTHAARCPPIGSLPDVTQGGARISQLICPPRPLAPRFRAVLSGCSPPFPPYCVFLSHSHPVPSLCFFVTLSVRLSAALWCRRCRGQCALQPSAQSRQHSRRPGRCASAVWMPARRRGPVAKRRASCRPSRWYVGAALILSRPVRLGSVRGCWLFRNRLVRGRMDDEQ